MSHRPTIILVAALAWAIAPAAIDAQTKPPALVVSVASSLADVMSELAGRHEKATGQAVRLNIAGSNVLARQIVEGAPADLFVSADDAQMDVAERAGRLVAGSRITLLTNRLVVVGPPATTLRVTGPRSLADPAVRRLALGNPESVPAGVYARQWLENSGTWSAVAGKVVPMLTVRAALAAVRAGRADAAVVYLTDARSEPSVPVLYTVPLADAPPVRYPAAVVDGPNRAAAERFLALLSSADAATVFTAAGFGLTVP